MTASNALSCRIGAGPQGCTWGPASLSPLAADAVRVAVHVASINPIDVKRATGYGRRVFGLLGARGDRLVLGQDFAGVVTAVGAQVRHLAVGDRVWGLLPVGLGGAHRDTLNVPACWLRPLPAGVPMAAAAVLPYTFTTLWRALGALGLQGDGARGRRVWVHGAGGALGQMAIQWLTQHGAEVDAVCGQRSFERSLALGAARVHDRASRAWTAAAARADAALNFGAWDDEAALAAALPASAIGLASTVHPLLRHIDEGGWLLGALRSARAWQGVRRQLAGGRYAWVVFKPDATALDALQAALQQGAIALPAPMRVAFAQAPLAFAHVARGESDRAVLVRSLNDDEENKA